MIRCVGCLLLAAVTVSAAKSPIAGLPCKTYTLARRDDYTVCWEVSGGVVTLNLTVMGARWLGFGIAEVASGWMAGADMALVRAADPTAIEDTFSMKNGEPIPDPCGINEWQLVSLDTAGGNMIAVVKRNLTVSSSEFDRSIAVGEQPVIIAYGSGAAVEYHENRRKAVTIAIIPADGPPSDFTHTHILSLMANTTRVPEAITAYGKITYDLFSLLPPGVDPATKHIVGYNFVGDDKGKPYRVHHLVASVCPTPVQSVVSDVLFAQGKTPMAFTKEGKVECEPNAYNLLLWVPGNDHFALPSIAGFSLVTARYLTLEWHYDNPTRQVGYTDNSGLEILLDDARPEEAAVLTIGDPLIWHDDTILPGQDFSVQHNCLTQCTDQMQGDFTLYQVQHHMHQIGAKARMSQRRNHAFLKDISRVEFYNFDYQVSHPPDTPSVLRKGDTLHYTCSFHNHRSMAAQFGLGSEDEMCMAFLVGWPAKNVPMQSCGPVITHQGNKHIICAGAQDQYPLVSPLEPMPQVVTDGNITVRYGRRDSCNKITFFPTPGAGATAVVGQYLFVVLLFAIVL